MQFFLMTSVIVLWAVVLCNLVLTLALIRKVNAGSPSSKPTGLEKGQQAPDFRAEQLSGESVTLAIYAGREVAFVFVSPGCKPCDEALPSYEAAFAIAARAGIDFVLVSTVDAELTRRYYIEEKAITLPMLVAPRGSNPFMDAYHLSGTPSYCVIDAQGKVLASGFAAITFRPWQNLVESWKIRAERVGV